MNWRASPSSLGNFALNVPGDYKIHVLPSAGVLAFSDPPFDIVRAGMMLYGISPLPEFQNDSAAGDDLENAHRSHSRNAEGQLDQLRPDIYHAEEDARGDALRRLCRWLSAPSFESRRGGSGSRATLRTCSAA